MEPEAKNSIEDKVYSFVQDIPNHISDKDFKNGEYQFYGFTELKFPSDYTNEGYLMKLMEIETPDKISIDTSIKFDTPFSLMEIALFDYLKSDARELNTLAEEFESVA